MATLLMLKLGRYPPKKSSRATLKSLFLGFQVIQTGYWSDFNVEKRFLLLLKTPHCVTKMLFKIKMLKSYVVAKKKIIINHKYIKKISKFPAFYAAGHGYQYVIKIFTIHIKLFAHGSQEANNVFT